MNNICGYLYEYKNSRYPSLTYELAGNYRNIDIAPQQKYALTIDAADTVRGKTIQVATHVQNVSFVYDPADEVLLTNVEFSQLSIRVLSSTTTGTYGAVSNYSGTAIVMPEFPPFPTLPPFPAFPIITGTSTTTAGVGYVFSLLTAGNDGSIDWVWSKSPPGVFLQDLVVTDADTAFLCPSDGLLNIYAVFKTREATGAGDVELDWLVLRTGMNGNWGALNSACNSSAQLSILDSEDKVRWHDRAWERIRAAALRCEGSLAVVTHGLVCFSLASRHLRLPPGAEPRGGFRNTSVTVIDGAPPWVVSRLACTEHLGPGELADGGRA